jgi:hypothetical protein
VKVPRTEGPLSIRDILTALDNQLTPQDNFQAKILGPIVTPGVANTEFTVQHNLGRVPTNYIWNVDQNAVVYDSRRASWTSQQLFLKCSATSVNLYLIIF